MRTLPTLFLLWLAACGPKAPPSSALEAMPVLPSPRASSYADVPGMPRDEAVARIAGKDSRWNESLSGAAAGLALNWVSNEGSLSGWEVREAAWQAGWAWPVLEVRGWNTAVGQAPPDEIRAWVESLPPEDTLGLVRARGRNGDAWVGLRGRPRGVAESQPRQVAVGAQLVFAPRAGATLTVADPTGRVVASKMESERPWITDVAGEWLFEVRDEQGLIAMYPVYVGMVPPETAVLAHSAAPTDADSAAEGFRQLLDEVREIYGRPAYRQDVLLRSAAASMVSGRSVRSTAEIAERLGYVPDTTWRISCRAGTLADCADQVLWNPRARSALLIESADVGIAAQVGAEGLQLVVLVAAH